MDQELLDIMDRIVRSQKSGDQAKIEEAMNTLKVYLKPYKEILFPKSVLNESTGIYETDETATK